MNSAKKLTRGQIVYAPISTTTQRISKSPFADSKRISGSSRHHQSSIEQQQSMQQPTSTLLFTNLSRTQISPRTDSFTNDQSSILKNPNSPFVDSQQAMEKIGQVQMVIKQNQLLRSREQIYISKLLQLQQGLQRQHEQFMNLQDIYTQLLNLYKQKEEEVVELELKFKQMERQRTEFSRRDGSNSRREENTSVMSIDKTNSIRNNGEENFKNELTQLIFQNKRLNDTNDKLVSELNYLRSKEKLQDSRQNLNSKIVEELNDWQLQFNQEREEKIKLEYQNKFFKLRNEDLEKTISDLEKVISMKQNQIIKMREEKINIRRQSSEKVLNRSPPKSSLESTRTKLNLDNKKYAKTIENLQKENQRLREENLHLKQKLKASSSKSPTLLAESSHIKMGSSMYGNGSHFTNLHRKLDFGQSQSKYYQDSMRSYQNQNFNSQNTNEQYFSFSRQRDERQSEEELPSFPMDLQIQGIIRKHQEKQLQKQIHQNLEQGSQILS